MISIVVPVYNVEKFLEKCIQSILSQTYKELELILVDDGSPDRCGIICDEYAQRDSRVHVLHQANQGVSCARNAGTAMAHGDYIMYIDSDDTVHPRMLEILYNMVKEQDAEVAVCGYRSLQSLDVPNEEYAALPPTQLYTGREIVRFILDHRNVGFITVWAKLYSRSLIPFLDYPKNKVYEDEYVSYKVFYNTKRVAFTPLPLYNYLKRENSITSSISVKACREALASLLDGVHFFEALNDEEMLLLARKRYLIALQLTWNQLNQIHAGNKEQKQELVDTWRSYNHKYGRQLVRYLNTKERMTRIVFQISPFLYGFITNLVNNTADLIRRNKPTTK